MKNIEQLLTTSQTKSELGSKPMTEEERVQADVDFTNSEVGNLNEADGYECPICKNRGYIAEMAKQEMFGYYYTARKDCKCMKARKALRRLNASGLKNVVKECSFDRYETTEEWQKVIKEKALKFLKDEDNHWFFMGGQSGAGKSHICTAIAVQQIRDGKEVKYMLWRDEITRIKAAVNDSEQYGKMMDALKKAEVLYIDDLFKSGKGEDGKYKPPTAADVNAAFEIINYRYNNPGKVTIISSERTLVELNEIDEAIAGRIAERTKDSGYCINLKKDASRNWRMKGLVEL